MHSTALFHYNEYPNTVKDGTSNSITKNSNKAIEFSIKPLNFGLRQCLETAITSSNE